MLPNKPIAGAQNSAVSQERLSILIVDDNPDDRLEIKIAMHRYSEQPLDITEAETIEQAAACLQARAFSCIVLDFNLPDGNALDLLARMPRTLHPQSASFVLRDPVVVLTDGVANTSGQTVLHHGAHEFVPKGGTTGLLSFVVTRAVKNAIMRHSTDRVIAEQAGLLFVGAERLRIAEETAGFGIWDWDVASGQIFISPQHRHLYGMAPQESGNFDHWLATYVHPDDRAYVARARSLVLRDSDIIDNGMPRVFRILHPRRGIRWIQAQAKLMRDAGNNLLRITTVSIDITDQKAAQEALRAAAREKDDLLAFIVHELRNPLSPIAAAAQVCIERSTDAADVQQAAAVIERQVAQVARLLDDLWDAVRMSRRELSVLREKRALQEILNSAVETSLPLLHAKQQQLTLDMPQVPIYLLADRARLVQVVGNLLNNASKYSGPNSRVTLSAHQLDHRVRIAVRDEGVGIDPAIRATLFQPFVQGSRDGASAAGGLGVGLALVRTLVESHGGTVQVHSNNPEPGSEFVVELPVFDSPIALLPAITPDRSAIGPRAHPSATRGSENQEPLSMA